MKPTEEVINKKLISELFPEIKGRDLVVHQATLALVELMAINSGLHDFAATIHRMIYQEPLDAKTTEIFDQIRKSHKELFKQKLCEHVSELGQGYVFDKPEE